MQTLVNRKNLKHAAVVLLFVLPAFIPLFIFWLYPIGRSIWLSFTDWDFMTPEYHFVWFKNYQALLKDSRFYAALWNTIIFTAGTLIPTIAGGLGLALLLRKNFKGSGFFKFVLFSHGSHRPLPFPLYGPGFSGRMEVLPMQFLVSLDFLH